MESSLWNACQYFACFHGSLQHVALCEHQLQVGISLIKILGVLPHTTPWPPFESQQVKPYYAYLPVKENVGSMEVITGLVILQQQALTI